MLIIIMIIKEKKERIKNTFSTTKDSFESSFYQIDTLKQLWGRLRTNTSLQTYVRKTNYKNVMNFVSCRHSWNRTWRNQNEKKDGN